MLSEFWLSEEQFGRLQPLLPDKVRGVARADDRRVISGIMHVLKSGGAGSMRRPAMGQGRRSTTASYAGPLRVSGRGSSKSWRQLEDPRQRS